MAGLCSGCEVAFAVADEPGVGGLMLWSAPVFAALQTGERVARKRSTHLRDYARKMLKPATWAKVLSGRLDVKGVGKVVAQGGGEEHKNQESEEAGHLPIGWRDDAMEYSACRSVRARRFLRRSYSSHALLMKAQVLAPS